jgi:hypothetical protein
MSPSPCLRIEKDPVSEMCFLVFKIPDDGQSRNPNNSKETYT